MREKALKNDFRVLENSFLWLKKVNIFITSNAFVEFNWFIASY